MNTYIRTHVKTDERFDLLKRTVESFFDKGMDSLGSLYIVNDSSLPQYSSKIFDLCSQTSSGYLRSTNPPSTKNGLFESVSHFTNETSDQVCLCCTDDMVFGKGIVDRINRIMSEDLNLIDPMWAVIGFFACYENRTRHNSSSLWKIPVMDLYALICHMFNREFVPHLIVPYVKYLTGEKRTQQEIDNMNHHDDLWVKHTAICEGFSCYNTYDSDYAQHTGMNVRTFEKDTNGSSNYFSKVFIGE